MWSLILCLTLVELCLTDQCGLSSLIEMPQYTINRDLLTTLAERWHSEHNTFHLPTGEITVTPEDVYLILRILVIGHIVYYDLYEQGDTDAVRRVFHDDQICGYDIPW